MEGVTCFMLPSLVFSAYCCFVVRCFALSLRFVCLLLLCVLGCWGVLFGFGLSWFACPPAVCFHVFFLLVEVTPRAPGVAKDWSCLSDFSSEDDVGPPGLEPMSIRGGMPPLEPPPPPPGAPPLKRQRR